MNLLSRITTGSVEVERATYPPLDLWSQQPTWLYGHMGVDQFNIARSFDQLVEQVHETDNVVAGAVLARQYVMSQTRFAFRNVIRQAADYRQLFGNESLALLEYPDPGNLTRPEMLAAVEAHVAYAGAAYVAKHGQDRLELLDPGLVDVVLMGVEDPYHMVKHRAGRKAGYVYWRDGRDGGEPEQWGLREVAHFRPEPHPVRWWTGASWVSSLLQEVSLDKGATRFLRQYFDKAATPNLIVKPHESLTAENVDAYREIFAKEYGGVGNAFKTMWLGGGSDVQVVGANLNDLDLKSMQGGLETRIAVRAQIPAPILGIRESLQGSALTTGNYGAARRKWADNWFSPHVQNLCASMQWLFPAPAGAELWYDPADVLLLQEDAKDAADIMATQSTALQALDSAGYNADAAVAAVRDGNLSALIGQHDGLQSVQRQPTDAGGEGNTDA